MFLRSRFFRIQGFQSPGFSGFGSSVWVQVLEVAMTLHYYLLSSSWKNNMNPTTERVITSFLFFVVIYFLCFFLELHIYKLLFGGFLWDGRSETSNKTDKKILERKPRTFSITGKELTRRNFWGTLPAYLEHIFSGALLNAFRHFKIWFYWGALTHTPPPPLPPHRMGNVYIELMRARRKKMIHLVRLSKTLWISYCFTLLTDFCYILEAIFTFRSDSHYKPVGILISH